MVQAVEVAERFADGNATKAELEAVAASLEQLTLGGDRPNEVDLRSWSVAALAQSTADPQPFLAAFSMTTHSPTLAGFCGDEATANAQVCDLLRDIFGNLFRPVKFSRVWRSDTAVSLAKHIYESRDFSAMPILADALQDADCDNDDVLNHCRDPQQVHVRGCWVVDLVLGKA